MKTLVYLALTLMTYGSHLWSMDSATPKSPYAFKSQFGERTIIDTGDLKAHDCKVLINITCSAASFILEPEFEAFYQADGSAADQVPEDMKWVNPSKWIIVFEQTAVFQAAKNSSEFRELQWGSQVDLECRAASLELIFPDDEASQKRVFKYDFSEQKMPWMLKTVESGNLEGIPFGNYPRLSGCWTTEFFYFCNTDEGKTPKIGFSVLAPNKSEIACKTEVKYYVGVKNPNRYIVSLGDINHCIKNSTDINEYIYKHDIFPHWTLKEIDLGSKKYPLKEGVSFYK